MSHSQSGPAARICPQCGYRGDPIDALFYLEAAAMLVPMTYDSLRKFLSRRKDDFPPVYFHVGRGRKRRVLTGEEVKRIREMLIAGPKLGTLNDLLRRA